MAKNKPRQPQSERFYMTAPNGDKVEYAPYFKRFSQQTYKLKGFRHRVWRNSFVELLARYKINDPGDGALIEAFLPDGQIGARIDGEHVYIGVGVERIEDGTGIKGVHVGNK